MKIIAVIVEGELPVSASRCDVGWDRWNTVDELEHVGCKYRLGWWLMTTKQFVTTRCPDCPLRLEHDNARIAQGVM